MPCALHVGLISHGFSLQMILNINEPMLKALAHAPDGVTYAITAAEMIADNLMSTASD